MDELLKKIQRKRLVFSVTTGRSGTNYMSFLLSLLRNFKSEHEGQPGFHEYYRSILSGSYSFREFWLSKKLPYIADGIKEEYYADVSHVACKGFLEPLIDLGVRPSFIMIKRANREVAKSLLQLSTIPLRTDLGLTFLNSPNDPGVLEILGDLKELTDYQLCYWYTLEIDRRMDFYKFYFGNHGCLYTLISFDELINGVAIDRVRKDLELPSMSFFSRLKFIRHKTTPLNEKKMSKTEILDIDFETEESLLRNRIKWQL